MEKTTIYKLRKILSYKKLNKKNYEDAYKLLLDTQDNPKVYYNYLGKVLLNEGKIEEAKQAFLKELSINKESVSAHYNLYKIGVLESDYKKAYDHLKFYNDNVNKEVNLELPLSMMKLYLDIKDYHYINKEDYLVKNSDRFVITKLENKEAIDIYNKAIYDFNNKDFIKLKEDLIKFDQIINEQNIKIEVNTLIKITDDIIKRINYEKNKPSRLINIKEILRNIDFLLYKDLLLAIEKLEMLKKNTKIKEYKIEIEYLENKIKEKQLYNNLNDKKKMYYNYYLENGKEARKIDNYPEALVCYQAGYYATKHPIFLYYIGRVYLQTKKLEEAEKMFLEYIEVGGEKLPMAYSSLTYIYNTLNMPKKKKLTKTNCSKINKVYEIKEKQEENDELDMIDNIIEEDKTEFDIEINKIKELYSQGNIKQADKLLIQLEKDITDKNKREEIQTLSKNKTLYKNKNK